MREVHPWCPTWPHVYHAVDHEAAVDIQNSRYLLFPTAFVVEVFEGLGTELPREWVVAWVQWNRLGAAQSEYHLA